MDADFEQLYNSYYMQVYSFVMTLAKNRDFAEEITQKTFFKAMHKRQDYQGNASESTWLCAIAKHLFLDEIRAQQKIASCPADTVSDADIEHAFANEDSAFVIHQVLHELEEPYKEVFQLRVFGELPFRKIGMLFQKTENWARITYHRARLKIQERMESYETTL